LGVEAELSGLDTLSFKETDRIEALAMELSNLGLEVNQTTNSIAFRGDIRVKKAYIKTYNDHRMAMSAALLATRLDLEIENPAVVSKSYPVFWDDLKRLTSGS
jgi:3-phosphoshikimate 1-carboxyvinyltransferase